MASRPRRDEKSFLWVFEVLGQIGNPPRQNGDLHLRRPNVRFVRLILGNDRFLGLLRQGHSVRRHSFKRFYLVIFVSVSRREYSTRP